MSNETPVEQAMSYAATVETHQTLREAARTLRTNDETSLVVLDEDDELIGILTATDIINALADDTDVDDVTVDEWMSHGVVSIRVEASLGEAARLLDANDIRHLPVVNKEGEVVGKLTAENISDTLARS